MAALFILYLCASSAHGQYRFDHWTADNGLPQNSVRDIVQTQDGYLWFTTFDGLVRFDGVRFTVFNKSNSPGLASNRFVSLLADRQGDLWATLETGEVVRRHQGRFTTFAQTAGLPGGPAPWLTDDGLGNVVVNYVQYNNDARQSVITGIVVRAYRWAREQFEPVEELSATFSGPPVRIEEAKTFTFGRVVEGDFWITGRERLIRYLRGGGARFYSKQNGLPGEHPALIWGEGRPLQVVTRDAADRLWLTELKSMRSQPLNAQAPDGFEITRGYADKEGNYWFSSYRNGLFRARRLSVTPFGRAQGLNAREVYPLLEGRDGALWIGAAGDGVYRFKDGAFTQYSAPKQKKLSDFSGTVHSLYEDRAGRLRVNGFWRLEAGRFVLEPWASALLSPSPSVVWTMCEDRAGAFWMGTDTGVVRYQQGTLTWYTTKDGLAGNDTKVIIEDGQGGLWLGSYGGLTHYKDGRFTAWTDKDGLPGNTVRALKQDGDGTLWIGTYDSGLGRFRDGRFTRYTVQDGLFDNGVFQILEDDYGWMWMSCNHGIYRVRKQELNDFADGRVNTLACLAYNKKDGLPSSECNGGRWPAGVKTRDGKLWFPTMDGVAMIDPATIKANPQPPPVVLETMRINNQVVPYPAWEAGPGNTQAIEIKSGQDNFEIEYTALSFINSENLRFRYKLEGADGDWVEAGTRRTAYFSHLAPGNYTFRVTAANADGVWNEAGASLRITVVPPFWRTWWFMTLAALGVAAALAVAWEYRVARLRRVQAAQQAFARQLIASQESERKRIAGELHDSLGQNLLIVKNWALVGLNALDADNPAREHLTEISETTSLALDEVREIAHNLRPYQLERLGLTNTLEYMIRNVRNSSDIEFTVALENVDGLLPPESEINLYRVVQEVINNVIKHSDATEAWLAIKRTAGGLQVVCRDNGKGFDLAAAVGSRHSGMGLSGLAERVRILGGHYTIESAPGAGATVAIMVDTRKG